MNLYLSGLSLLILRSEKPRPVFLASAVSIGLAFDAVIIAVGMLVGEGSFLEFISQVRYILHGMLVPLLLPIAFYTYGLKSRTTKIIR